MSSRILSAVVLVVAALAFSCAGTKPSASPAVEQARAAAPAKAVAKAPVVPPQEEPAACKAVPPGARDVNPFTDLKLVSVETLENSIRQSKGPSSHKLYGVRLTVAADLNQTAQRLERILKCHAALHATLGSRLAESPGCPLAGGASEISVTESSLGLLISIWSDGEAAATKNVCNAMMLRGIQAGTGTAGETCL
jgi:hypothetical protein